MNRQVELMLKIPGRHAVTTPLRWALLGAYAIVEVDETGKCWELNHSMQRENELSPDGWDKDILCLEFATIDHEASTPLPQDPLDPMDKEEKPAYDPDDPHAIWPM